MSTALAIAGVTATLRDLLNDGLINHDITGTLGSTVTVSALPPDRVVSTSGTEETQLNIFLYQVTPNTGWKNINLPSVDAAGRQRLSNPPLALDLHYLISAYSAADLHGEILLGFAALLLHDNPVITREALRTALDPSPDVGVTLPPALRALANSGLADQIEQLRITPEYLDTEQMSRLWAATQSHYRPTAAYNVSVVLIESQRPTRSPLPVLSRGPVDPVTSRERGVVVQPSLLPPVPTLDELIVPGNQPVARLGETIDLAGHHLDGTNRQVLLENDRFQIREFVTATGSSDAHLMQFQIPASRAADFPVGSYRVSAEVITPGETDPRRTSQMAMILAPAITNLPQDVTRDSEGTASFSLDFNPTLRAGQTVSLFLGQQEIAPDSHSTPTGSLDFSMADAPVGNHLARLRIDGIDSPIIDRSVSPPEFLDQRVNVE